MSKIDSAIKMFKRALSQGFKVDYVLVDSWFTCSAFINAVLSVKKQVVHLIGMYKIPKTKFGYAGGMYTHSQIRNMLGKQNDVASWVFITSKQPCFIGTRS